MSYLWDVKVSQELLLSLSLEVKHPGHSPQSVHGRRHGKPGLVPSTDKILTESFTGSSYTLAPSSSMNEISKASQKLFGKEIGYSEWGQLAGIPDGARLDVFVRTDNVVRIEGVVYSKDALKPSVHMERTIFKGSDGKLTMSNEHFFIDQRAKSFSGFGTRSFATQVSKAQELGVSRITTLASRSSSMNGYYTWARLGYDAEIYSQAKVLKQLPPSLAGAKRVSDLMATPEGVALWKKYGDAFRGDFDPKPGSKHTKALNAYLAEKGIDIEVKSLQVKHGGGSHPESSHGNRVGKAIPNISQPIVEAASRSQEQIMGGFAAHRGMTVDEYKGALNDHAKRLLDEASVFVRVPRGKLAAILSDGELKNQHATGTSQALYRPDLRVRFENEVYGIPTTAPPSERPIAGYAHQSQTGGFTRWREDLLNGYGDVAIKLKEPVKDRSHVIGGDSYDSIMTDMLGQTITYPNIAPSSFRDPQWYSLPHPRSDRATYNAYGPLAAKGAHGLSSSYTETQIHGGVKLADIDTIYFSKKGPNAGIASKLSKLGIPYEVVDPMAEKSLELKHPNHQTGTGQEAHGRRGKGAVPFGGDMRGAYPDAPTTNAVSDDQADDVMFSMAEQQRLDADGGMLLYHVTEVDSLSSIQANGLVPAFNEAPGQSWKAEHSSYATYFHTSKAAVENEIANAKDMDIDIGVVTVSLPVTPAVLSRLLPDEDTGYDLSEGIASLLNGETVAVIGGVPAEYLTTTPGSEFKSFELKHPNHQTGTGQEAHGRRSKVSLNPAWQGMVQKTQDTMGKLREQVQQLGLNSFDYEKQLVDRLQAEVDAMDPYTKTSLAGLNGILKDGRFKTQFETGTSRGLNDPDVRARYEETIFGYDKQMDPTNRPVYGYMSKRIATTADLAQYGDVTLKLKSHVRDDASITFGDSIDSTYAGMFPSQAPVPAKQVNLRVLPIGALVVTSDLRKVPFERISGKYVEAQYHGGLKANDIQTAYFKKEPSNKLKGLLDKHGIEWDIEPKWDEEVLTKTLEVKHPNHQTGTGQEVHAPKKGGKYPQHQLFQTRKPRKLSFGDEDTTNQVMETLFGKRLSPQEIMDVAGIPDGSDVHVEGELVGYMGEATLRIGAYGAGMDLEMNRIFQDDGDMVSIHNDVFIINDAKALGSGLGTASFATQVNAAREYGFQEIETTAAGSGAASYNGMNGYYTWPRLGYDMPLDMPLSPTERGPYGSKLTKRLFEDKDVYMVSHLMKTPEDRKLWKEEGAGSNMRFDLSDGSESIQVLNAYLKAKDFEFEVKHPGHSPQSVHGRRHGRGAPIPGPIPQYNGMAAAIRGSMPYLQPGDVTKIRVLPPEDFKATGVDPRAVGFWDSRSHEVVFDSWKLQLEADPKFTIAHEIGHSVIDRRMNSRPAELVDFARRYDSAFSGRSAEDAIETLADLFAARTTDPARFKRIVEFDDEVALFDELLGKSPQTKHPGHSPQSVHGRRYGRGPSVPSRTIKPSRDTHVPTAADIDTHVRAAQTIFQLQEARSKGDQATVDMLTGSVNAMADNVLASFGLKAEQPKETIWSNSMHRALGVKHWDCRMEVDISMARVGVGSSLDVFATVVHERIHGRHGPVTDQRVKQEYADNPGYEEGITESVTRMALAKNSVLTDPSATRAYDAYVSTFSEMAKAVGVPEVALMKKLYAAPLGRSASNITGIIDDMKGTSYKRKLSSGSMEEAMANAFDPERMQDKRVFPAKLWKLALEGKYGWGHPDYDKF